MPAICLRQRRLYESEGCAGPQPILQFWPPQAPLILLLHRFCHQSAKVDADRRPDEMPVRDLCRKAV
jgi:hypothetical protein